MAFKFDNEKKILYAYKSECAVPDIKNAYQLNASVYKNAQKYYNDPNYLRREMVEKWFPAFQRMLGVTDEQFALADILIQQQDPDEPMRNRMSFDYGLDSIDYKTKTHQKGSKVDHFVKYNIYMKFKIRGFTDTEFVPVMSIPWVREDGIIEYNGAEYAFIHMLEQTDGISYNPNNTNNNPPKITLRTNRNNINLFSNEKNGIMVELGKSQSVEMISLISAVLRKEMPSENLHKFLNDVWDEFADSDIVNLKYRDIDKFNLRWYYAGGSNRRRGASDITEHIAPQICGLPIDNKEKMYNKYETTNLREQLNSLLSLRQAVNKKLAKDVYSKDGTLLYHAGRIVTDSMVDNFERNGVYIIYVEDEVDIDGAILDEDIITPLIPRGTLVTDEIEAAFPEEDGMYVCKDYYARDYVGKGVDDIFMIDKGTVLNNSHVDRIKSSGREGVFISTGKNKRHYVSFITEVISNKQFKGSWIGKEAGEWYYLNVDGDYVKQPGIGYTAYDLIALWSYAVKALRGQATVRLPNIDDDFRKQLIPINEQFSRAMNYAIQNGMKQMKQTFNAFWKSDKIVMFTMCDSELVYKFYAFERLFWEYLVKESKCVRMIPNVALNNPIAYISEITKANVYTASKNSVSDSQRTISIGSYGKIDPYEIPQSGKIGVVNNLCSYVNIDEDGKITTPYYKVKQSNGKAYVDFASGYHQMTVEQEEHYVIADICSLNIAEDGTIKQGLDELVLCMVPGTGNNRRMFEKVPLRRVNYINVNAMQPLSWASSTIPFLCNNDAARAVFAVAQMKQAKGLVNPEEPLVMTSAYEMIPKLNRRFGYVAREDEHLMISRRDPVADAWTIMTTEHDGSNMRQDYKEFHYYQEFTQGDNSVMTIKPEMFVESDMPTATTKMKEGDVALSTNFMSNRGIMQFGVNTFVLFIPDGFNYEDSAHISETYSEKMASYRVNEETLPIKLSPRMPRIRDTKEHPISTSIPFAPNTDNDTFDITYNDHSKGITKFQRKIKHAYGNYIGQYGHIKEGTHLYDGVVVQLLSRDNAKKGDKISNRHGNKCTVCSVSNADMPYINNGVQADAVLNPLGVGSRMNIGQIKEMHLGLVMHVLGLQTSSDAYNCISDIEIKTLLHFVWAIANETTHYTKVPDGTFPADLDAVMRRPEFKDIPPMIRQHVRDHYDTIQMWRNTFDKNGNFEYYYLEEVTDENGNTTVVKKKSKTKAAGGFIYMFKLTQESYKKIHARGNDMSDEEYSKLTDAPTQGASRGGGQRMGTMEIDALCAYDAKDYIYELFNVRADNAIARENFNLDTYFDPKNAKEYKQNSKGQRRAVTELLYTLLALGIMTEADANEIIALSKNNGEDLKHVKGQVIQRTVGKGSKKKNPDGSEEEVEESTQDDSLKEASHSVMSKINFTEG